MYVADVAVCGAFDIPLVADCLRVTDACAGRALRCAA